MRVRDLPMLYVTFSNITCLLGYTSPFILIQFGWLISWVYLRFYRYNPENGTRGDRSETFAFVLWFPPFVRKPLGIGTTFLHGLFARFHIIPRYHYEYVPGDLEFEGGQEGGPSGGGGTTARAEAERRRAMALKALDQRMAGRSASGNTTTSANANGGPSTGAGSAGLAAPSRPSAPVPPPELVFQAPDDDEPLRASAAKAATTPLSLVNKKQEEEPEWPSSGEEDGGDDGDIGASNGKKGKRAD